MFLCAPGSWSAWISPSLPCRKPSAAWSETGSSSSTAIAFCAERLLLDVIQMPWEHVHIEACRWEHVMSEELEQYISKMVSGVKDPFGNPIPPEGATGPGSSCAEVAGLVSVEEFVARNSGGEILVARIGEVLQTDPDVLLNLREAGLLPGARARLEVHDAVVKAVSDSGSMELSEWVQKHLQVQRV